MTQLHLTEWVKFCQETFPTNEVPPYPSKKSDLPLTYQIAIDEWNQGKLSQNLFANKVTGAGLPADVALRLQKQALLPSDADALERAGLTFYAHECRVAQQRTDDLALEKAARLSAERSEQLKKTQEEWAALPLGHPSKAPSPEQVAHTRQQWGISGLAEWQKN